jgi:hypothetical protein
MGKADDILMFDVIFSLLLFAFGAATGTANLSVFQSVQAPTLAPLPKGSTCNPVDFGCNASKDIVQATAYIGWAFVNLPVLLIFFSQFFVLFANQVLSVTFSSSFSPNGVPFLGIFFSGLQLYIVWEVVRTLRGSSTGV